MSNYIIEASGLGKRYHIGTQRTRRRSNFRDVIAKSVTAPVRNLRRLRARSIPSGIDQEGVVWALRDVSFALQQGEVLGIVGRNGAGKSTLLKVLSRITDPTVGYVDIRGRVGSLLEVGTGFHPELTGRDNIYLNGSILGMDRAHIRRRFDEIVEFSGVHAFLDTPVKHFSSGMRVRLAFAVAAHLEPEVLIIDEVLAVGDVQFQRKCLAKMDDIGRGGRTVLFVSHDMSAVKRLCTRGLLIDGGRIAMQGPVSDVVARYISDNLEQGGSGLPVPDRWIDLSQAKRSGSGHAQFQAIRYSSGDASLGNSLYTDGPLEVAIAIHSDIERRVRNLAVRIYDPHGTRLINADVGALGHTLRLREGRTVVSVRIDALHLNAGSYVVGLWLSDDPRKQAYDELEAACRIEVIDIRPVSGALSGWGVVPCTFAVKEIDEAEDRSADLDEIDPVEAASRNSGELIPEATPAGVQTARSRRR